MTTQSLTPSGALCLAASGKIIRLSEDPVDLAVNRSIGGRTSNVIFLPPCLLEPASHLMQALHLVVWLAMIVPGLVARLQLQPEPPQQAQPLVRPQLRPQSRPTRLVKRPRTNRPVLSPTMQHRRLQHADASFRARLSL